MEIVRENVFALFQISIVFSTFQSIIRSSAFLLFQLWKIENFRNTDFNSINGCFLILSVLPFFFLFQQFEFCFVSCEKKTLNK